MLSKLPDGFLPMMMQLGAIILFSTVALGIGGVIWYFVHAVTKKQYMRFFAGLITVLSSFAAAGGWILNFGWLRFFLTIVPVSLFYLAFFIAVNMFATLYIDKSLLLKILSPISCVSYILFCCFLPDGGDYGGMYSFFTLIKNEKAIEILYGLSVMFIMVNLSALIIQLVHSIRLAVKSRKSKIEMNENNEALSEG